MSDVAVIGAGFGGLASALRLRKLGHNVTVYERLAEPGGRAQVFKRKGYKHDAGPTVITAPFLFDELFTLFGKNRNDYIEFVPLDPWYRFLFNDHTTFDYGGTVEDTLEEIAKISPDDCEGYKRLVKKSEAIYRVGFEQLAHVPFHRLSSMVAQLPALARLRGDKSVWDLVCSHLKHDKLRRAFSIQPLLVGGSPFDTTSIYGLIHYLEREHGVFFAKGGTGALVHALTTLAKEEGVAFEYGVEVDKFEVDGKRIESASTTNGQTISADDFVFNGDPMYLYNHLLPTANIPIMTRLKRDKAKLSMGLYVLFFGTNRTYDDVAHHTIVLGETYRELLSSIFHDKQLSEDVSLYLHRPTATDKSFAPEGHDSFYVLCPVPNNSSGLDWSKEESALRELIIRTLEDKLLPGLSHTIQEPFSMTPDDFEADYCSFQGSGFSMAPLFTQSAWFRFHNQAEGFDNLILTGAGSHPGAGLPGVVSSAKVVEQLMMEKR